MFHEYPKALYRGEEMTVVADKQEEDEMRAAGFQFYADQDSVEVADCCGDEGGRVLGGGHESEVKRGRGRPRKAA